MYLCVCVGYSTASTDTWCTQYNLVCTLSSPSSGDSFIGKVTRVCLRGRVVAWPNQGSIIQSPPSQNWHVSWLLWPVSPPVGYRTTVLSPSTTTTACLSTPRAGTSEPPPRVKWAQLEMRRNMCPRRCLFVLTGWTTSGRKWLVIWARSLGIYEALKCWVSGEGGLAAAAQAGRQATGKGAGPQHREPRPQRYSGDPWNIYRR